MPASIRVESGITAGTSYWVDRPVLRIGSDPQCEICLPSADLAPHALTLEFRAGQYRAYNRAAGSIKLGSAVLSAGGNGIWEADEAIHLPGDLRLVLDVEGDPQPCPRPESRAIDGELVDGRGGLEVPPPAGEATPTKSSRTLVQLGVIGICVLLMAVLLMRGGGEEAAPQQLPAFEALVERLIAEGEPSARLRHRLQFAEAAVVRGHYPLARLRYMRLRERLTQPAGEAASQESETRRLVRAFVDYRIGQLQ